MSTGDTLNARTTLLRCLAASGVWYALAVVIFPVVFTGGDDSWYVPAIWAAQLALIPWLIDAVVIYIVVREMAVNPWVRAAR